MKQEMTMASRLTKPFCGIAALSLCLVATSAAAQPAAPTIILLGTAGRPPAHADRSQPATLLRIGPKNYLIDAGENVGQQLVRAGVPARALSDIFLTHLHWDHLLGLGYLMATGWMTNRSEPLPVWGPPGTSRYISSEKTALSEGEDIFRAQSPERPALSSLYPAKEITVGDAPVEIYADALVRVRAVANTHFSKIHSPPHDYGVDRSYAYRFDTAQGSVVFTGDTGPSTAVTKLAKGADVLVTEVCDLKSIKATMLKLQPASTIDKLVQHMAEQHLSPDEVGRMAEAAGVRKVVLTHFVAGANFDPTHLLPAIRARFKGEIVLGKDLLEVPVRGE